MGLLEPDGRYGGRDGEVPLTGMLAGIARHARPKGPMETLDQVEISVESGLHGDFRGAIRPGAQPNER